MTNNIKSRPLSSEGMEESFSDHDGEHSFEEECPHPPTFVQEKENVVSNKDKEKGKLELKVSLSLYRKLHDKAKVEGVDIGELASELLAEGLVLRAWEIMERKTAMKGGGNISSANVRTGRPSYNNNRNNNHNSNSQAKGRYRQGASGSQNKNHKRPKFSHQEMGDNANFIEYVRSQEKKNSW